jgi:hypothetical protein
VITKTQTPPRPNHENEEEKAGHRLAQATGTESEQYWTWALNIVPAVRR